MRSTIDKTLEHIMFLSRHLDQCDIRGAIIVILMEIKMPTNQVGFEFLKYAIHLQKLDPTRSLTNDIYAEICLRYRQNSEKQVEQAIMNAIKMAWRHGSKEAWDWYFSYDGKSACKPSNSEFISRIAYLLELWQQCRKGGPQ